MRERRRRRLLRGRVARHTRGRRAPLRLGLGEQARDRGRGARRARGGDRLARAGGGTARLDAAAPARARLGAALRGGGAAGAARKEAHLLERRLRTARRHARARRGDAVSRLLRGGLGLPARRLGGPWRRGAAAGPRHGRARARPARADRSGDARRGDERPVRRARRRPTRLRPLRAERLRPRPRASRQQAAPLDRRRQLAARPSATSAAPARFSGSTRGPVWPSPASPTAISASGRRTPGPGSPMPCSPRPEAPGWASCPRRARASARGQTSAGCRRPAPAAHHSRTRASSGSP